MSEALIGITLILNWRSDSVCIFDEYVAIAEIWDGMR